MSARRGVRPQKRDGYWRLVRRVPKKYRDLDKRGIVRLSTNIAVLDDPRGVRAGRIVEQMSRELDHYWQGLLDGQSAEATRRFVAAQQRAKAMGLHYATAEELASSTLDEIKQHIAALVRKGSVESESDVAAALGGEHRPQLRLSELVGEFEKIQAAGLRDYSPQQLKKWRNPRTMTVDVWKGIVGDLPLTSLSREHALQLRTHWQLRVVKDGLDIGTANTAMGALAKMLRAVEIVHQLGIKDVFKGLRLEGEVDKQRAAFTVEYIQGKLFADDALGGLNPQARAIVWVVAETGLRLSEAANLLPETIVLDHAVPHIQVRPIGRKLKTVQSERDVPLVGAALVAMKLFPAGFPRYRDKGASLSAAVNKYLAARKLLPSDNHSLYSLRHAFEDRLTAVEAPEKVIAALMGHKYSRPKYGAGPSLEQKHAWLTKIALQPPKHFGPLE